MSREDGIAELKYRKKASDPLRVVCPERRVGEILGGCQHCDDYRGLVFGRGVKCARLGYWDLLKKQREARNA